MGDEMLARIRKSAIFSSGNWRWAPPFSTRPRHAIDDAVASSWQRSWHLFRAGAGALSAVFTHPVRMPAIAWARRSRPQIGKRMTAGVDARPWAVGHADAIASPTRGASCGSCRAPTGQAGPEQFASLASRTSMRQNLLSRSANAWEKCGGMLYHDDRRQVQAAAGARRSKPQCHGGGPSRMMRADPRPRWSGDLGRGNRPLTGCRHPRSPFPQAQLGARSRLDHLISCGPTCPKSRGRGLLSTSTAQPQGFQPARELRGVCSS